MLQKILSWLKEKCPYCKQPLIGRYKRLYTIKACRDGHYRVEIHPLLETRIEYHGRR